MATVINGTSISKDQIIDYLGQGEKNLSIANVYRWEELANSSNSETAPRDKQGEFIKKHPKWTVTLANTSVAWGIQQFFDHTGAWALFFGVNGSGWFSHIPVQEELVLTSPP